MVTCVTHEPASIPSRKGGGLHQSQPVPVLLSTFQLSRYTIAEPPERFRVTAAQAPAENRSVDSCALTRVSIAQIGRDVKPLVLATCAAIR